MGSERALVFVHMHRHHMFNMGNTAEEDGMREMHHKIVGEGA